MIICITGIDGCGKTTQISLLNDYLLAKGRPTFISKAYGPEEKAKFAEYIEGLDAVSLLFLFQAFHNEQCLKAQQALADGRIVLADRWDESYLAYHSQFGVLSSNDDLRARLNALAFRNLKPNFTFLLDLTVVAARARRSNGQADFFDRQPASYHQKMAGSYLQQASKIGWIVLDGAASPGVIHQQIIEYLNFAV